MFFIVYGIAFSCWRKRLLRPLRWPCFSIKKGLLPTLKIHHWQKAIQNRHIPSDYSSRSVWIFSKHKKALGSQSWVSQGAFFSPPWLIGRCQNTRDTRSSCTLVTNIIACCLPMLVLALQSIFVQIKVWQRKSSSHRQPSLVHLSASTKW